MSKRVMGKASFCHIQDLKGTIQVYVARDNTVSYTHLDVYKRQVLRTLPVHLKKHRAHLRLQRYLIQSVQ